MEAVIISVGNELTTGQCVDTNAVWLAGELNRHGIRVKLHITVGDDVDDLVSVIRRSMHDSDMTLVTGGLGPTPDDITRDAIAKALGEELEERPNVLEQIEALFAGRKRPMAESNRVQAMVPRGCDIIPNRRGTAPGIYCRRSGTRLFALPGVPSEMKEMVAESVVPIIRVYTKESATAIGKLHCFGMSEARIGEVLAEMMDRGRNPLIGTSASEAVITLRIVAKGGSRADSDSMIATDKSEIRSRLRRIVFGEDDQTLQGVVGQLLIEQSKTISTSESCTGGLLAKMLTDVPGSSAYFLQGLVTYANESKVELLGVDPNTIDSKGAVSQEVAEQMALRCLQVSHSDYAVSITGIAGPSGGSHPGRPVGLVYIGLASKSGVEVVRVLHGEQLTRAEIRDRSCKRALDVLRHRLLDTDINRISPSESDS